MNMMPILAACALTRPAIYLPEKVFAVPGREAAASPSAGARARDGR